MVDPLDPGLIAAVQLGWINSTIATPNDIAFWKKEVLAPDGLLRQNLSWLGGDLDKIDAVATTAGMTRDQLVAAVNTSVQQLPTPGSNKPVLWTTLLYARLRLDDLTGKNVWPKTGDELRVAASWPTQMSAGKELIGLNSADFNRMSIAHQRQAWARFVVNASNELDLKEANLYAHMMDVTNSPLNRGDVTAALKGYPTAIYNMQVYYLKHESLVVPKPELTDAVNSVMQAVKRLPAGDKALVLEQFKRIAPDPTTDQVRAAIIDDTWYRWPTTAFSPLAYVPPPPPPVSPVTATVTGNAAVHPDNPSTPTASSDNSDSSADHGGHRKSHTPVP